jgi:glycosyltransferase involved in cell wall biosynthesis
MIAGRFPPCVAFPTSAARIGGFAAWLHKFGWHPLVIAPEVGTFCDCAGCQSGSLDDDERYELVRVAVRARASSQLSSRVAGRDSRLLANFQKAGQMMGGLIRDLDPISDWPAAALTAADEILGQRQVQAVWASCQPVSSLWPADRLASRYDLPWIADLRDAMTIGWEARQLKSLAALARSRGILRRAARVVEVTPQLAAHDGRWLRRQCDTIISGFDPQQWESARAEARRTRSGYFEVVCAGKMYEGYRTLRCALDGFRVVRESQPDAPLRLLYYGRSGDVVKREAMDAGVTEMVECRGFVVPETMRTILAAADALLLPTNTAGHSGMPGGKLYEYLAAMRPILAVPGEDEFVAGVLNDTEAGPTARDPEQVARLLLRWLDEWSTHGTVTYHGRPDVIGRFSITESARQLATLLDSAVRDRLEEGRHHPQDEGRGSTQLGS